MEDGGGPGPSTGGDAERTGAGSPDLGDLRERVARAVRRHCPAWLAGQAEDIVQNAVMRLLRTLEKSAGNRKGLISRPS